MTQYVDLLTLAIFEVIKNGDPRQFEADFRTAFLQAATKERLTRGQKQSFYSPVRSRVIGRVSRYRKRCPQLPLKVMPLALSVPGPPSTPMPESFRQWYQDFKSRQSTQ